METKEPIKIKLNKLIILIGMILFLGLIIVAVVSNREQDIEQYYINGKHYIEQGQVINSYSDYIKAYANNSEVITLLQNIVNENFFNSKSLIVLEDSTNSVGGIDGHVSKINIKNNIANITIKRDNKSYGFVAGEIRTYFIPIDNKNITDVNIEYKFPFEVWDVINPVLIMSPFIILGIAIIKFVKTRKKIKTTLMDDTEKKTESKKAIKKLIGWIVTSGLWGFILESIYAITSGTIYKPIIYLYPQKTQELSVKLGYKDKITVSYPKYTTGWNIVAQPNGDLIDLNTNKHLYSLYYESDAVYKFKVEKDGFIVKKEDIIKFLEDKLLILGLTYKEAEEFIIYWLPILQRNNYNYIRFATIEEINQNMPLEFSVQPDSLIRVLMTYKGLNRPIEVEEQQLEIPDRTGFVAVEWGGTEIK